MLCNPLFCILKSLNINKKLSPLKQRPGDIAKLVLNSVINLGVMILFLLLPIWLQLLSLRFFS
jgi:hypothetical protein